MRSVRDGLAPLAILFLSLFIRVYGLGDENIWIDEVFSVRLANLSLSEIVAETSQDVHTPFYYMILHYWVAIFGDSEFSVRFPSAVFGFLAVFMIYKTGSLIFDKRTGVLSSLILGLSVFHIFYSQDARMYSLMSLLTLVSFYSFIRLLRERSLVFAVGYVLSSALLIYTHYFGVFIIIAQNIYVLTLLPASEHDCKLSFRRWVLLQVLVTFLFAPWVVVLVEQILKVRGGYWIPEPSVETLVKSFKLYSGPYLFLPFLILSLISAVACKKIRGGIDRKRLRESIEGYCWNIRPSDTDKIYLLLLWLLIPIILPFMISKVSTPVYWDRYTIGASLAFYILAAKGISSINYKYAKFAVIGMVIVISSVNVWKHHTSVNKEKWKEVAGYLDTNAGINDLILFHAGTPLLRGSCQFNFDYYSRRTGLTKKPFPKEHNDVDGEDINELRSIAESRDRVWVILAYTNDGNREMIKKGFGEFYNSFIYKDYVSYTYATDDYPTIELYLFENE